MAGRVSILGVFVADLTFRADRQPSIGETLLGTGFALGPGGKGSNQAVAAARAGAETVIITRLGRDMFADMADEIWAEAGVRGAVMRGATPTGAAHIYVENGSGDNAIIIYPGAAGEISVADVESQRVEIEHSDVFITQLEQPLKAAIAALEIAKAAGVTTILNPAPARALPQEIYPLCDYVTPNETEAEQLTGIKVVDIPSATQAAERFCDLGAKGAIITLGAQGALLFDGKEARHVPAVVAGEVVETTGAGDAFNGSFAAALARGLDPLAATGFGCAAAGISVTRPGTAPSMPTRAEIEALLSTL